MIRPPRPSDLVALALPLALATGLAWAGSRAQAAEAPFEVLATTREVTTLLVVRGHLLVGTTGGLVEIGSLSPAAAHRRRLPGVAVRALVSTSALASASASASASADGGRAFALAATDRGLVALEPHAERWWSRSAVSAVFVEAGELWTGHPGGLLRRWRGHEPGPAVAVGGSAPLHTLLRHGGRLWAASVQGLWSSVDGARFTRGTLGAEPLAGTVQALTALRGGLFAGGPGGLWRHGGHGWERLGPAEGGPHVAALGEGPGGEVVVGTVGEGLHALRGRELVPFGNVRWCAALACFDGAVVAGTPDEGVRLASRAPVTRHDDEPPSNGLTSVAALDGRVLLGTFERGVGVLQGGRWSSPGGRLPSSWVNQVAWVGATPLVRVSDGAVLALAPGGARWRPLGKRPDGWPKDWTAALGMDGASPWVGTVSALYRFEGDRWTVDAPKPWLQGRTVLDVARRGRELWLGTHEGGLYRWEPGTEAVRQYSLGSGLPDSWVTCVEVAGGAVWAGTFNGGLARLAEPDGTAGFEAFSAGGKSGGGLPSDEVLCMQAVGAAVLVGTMAGLTWTDGARWATLGAADGLPAAAVRSVAVEGASAWLATDAGLVRVDLALWPAWRAPR